MQLESHIHAIQEDLATTANLGDDAIAEAARALSDALASTLHLRLLDLLGEATLEIGGQLESGRVEVRLAGRDPELVVVLDETRESAQVPAGEEYTGRISLRLPESLKVSIETAAAQEGISTNAWIVRTLANMLESRRGHRRSRNRLQGYAQG